MDTSHTKELLLAELATVERELAELGIYDTETESWKVRLQNIDTSATEPDELADRVEEYEEQQDELDVLQARREDIVHALARIEEGAYGTCEICGVSIEAERLDVQPAARTCVLHG